jgi:outer membrane cobalamin receptor
MNVEYQYLEREAGVPGPASFPSPNARQEDSRRGLHADFTYLPSTGWDVKAGVSSTTQTMRFEDPAPPSFDPAFPAEPVVSRHENRSLGADLQWDFDTGAGELYTLGGEFSSDRIESSNDGEHETERWGVYAQDQWRSGGLSAVGAVRRDEHSVYGGQTSPSLTVTFETPDWRVWGASARGYRAPNFDDLYWSDQYMKGNPDLKPESSWSWEAGVESRWGEAGNLRLAYFRRRVRNLIRWLDDDGDFIYQPENTARARVSGFEGEMRYRVTRSLTLPVGYQALSTEDEETGEQVKGLVRSLWRVGAEYAGGSFTSSLTWSHTDRGSFSYRDAAWEYATLDAAIGWKGSFGKTPVRASLRVENLRDRAYETVEGYPMPGRTFFAEIGIGI